MDRLLTPLLRRVYAGFALCVGIYLGVLLFQYSGWNKERLYRQLLSGSEKARNSAAFDLGYLKGESQLVRALRARRPEVRMAATLSLWDLWARAGGRAAFRQVQAANRAVDRSAYAEALDILTRVTQRYPDFPEGWNRRATVYWLTGKFEEAVADATKAVALNPNHFGAWQGLGMCHARLGDLEEACRCIRTALRITPYDQSLRRLLGQCEEVLDRLNPRERVRRDII